jgi:CheY-like chemotaxis protein
MKVLIAEDEQAISMQYRIVLEERGHEVIITHDGQECFDLYMHALLSSVKCQELISTITHLSDATSRIAIPPFDVVVLDYKMPKKDGMETARGILDVCPNQRIMFASAYTVQTLMDSVKSLHMVVELLQKPFDLEYFADAIEDQSLHEQLERLNERVSELRDFSSITNSQLIDLLAGVKKLQSVILHD